MNKTKIYELFEKLIDLTSIEDIGFELIQNNRLIPIMKTKIGRITEDDWLKHHMDNPVYIKNNPILIRIVETKKSQCIKDHTQETSKDMDSFSIYSTYMFPIISNEKVIGIIPLVSIGEKRILDNNTIDLCENLINEYKNFFL